MDIQAYIQSGIIESYVLGLADADEVAELLRMSNQYPEVAAAIVQFEAELKQQLENSAPPPSPALKAALMQELAPEFRKPAVVKPLQSWLRYAAAASIILLIGSASLNLYLYNEVNETKGKYQALLVEKNSIIADNKVYQTKMQDMLNSLQMMNDPAMKKVMMPGVKGKEQMLTTVYWDSRSKDVYVFSNNMPAAPAGFSYQLWAIVDGKPVDAGVMDNCAGLCRMKNIPKAEMFAITLEKAGGSPVPTLTQMLVAGKV